ncbi:hypothetical protein V6N11_031640 [Hibiscus sabdariffa]|uniref:Uncharacterized protein n=1 Tax=Hibiscus sabdariffa TaxID=183260 RepID=A0ABR2SY90_9ROSI
MACTATTPNSPFRREHNPPITLSSFAIIRELHHQNPSVFPSNSHVPRCVFRHQEPCVLFSKFVPPFCHYRPGEVLIFLQSTRVCCHAELIASPSFLKVFWKPNSDCNTKVGCVLD